MGSVRDGDGEGTEVANHIYAQRTPLQMSHGASSILDFTPRRCSHCRQVGSLRRPAISTFATVRADFQTHQCWVAASALAFARKKRIISRLALGPRGFRVGAARAAAGPSMAGPKTLSRWRLEYPY